MKQSLHVALMRHVISTHELKSQLDQASDHDSNDLVHYASQYLDECNQVIHDIAEQSWRTQG